MKLLNQTLSIVWTVCSDKNQLCARQHNGVMTSFNVTQVNTWANCIFPSTSSLMSWLWSSTLLWANAVLLLQCFYYVLCTGYQCFTSHSTHRKPFWKTHKKLNKNTCIYLEHTHKECCTSWFTMLCSKMLHHVVQECYTTWFNHFLRHLTSKQNKSILTTSMWHLWSADLFSTNQSPEYWQIELQNITENQPVRSFINCLDRAVLLIRKQNLLDISAVENIKVIVWPL